MQLRRAALFFGGDTAARMLAFFAVIVGARVLGPHEFGRFTLVFAVVSICLLVADFGLTPLIMRRLSDEFASRREIVWSASSVNLGLATITYGLVLTGFGILQHEDAVLVGLYGLVLFLHALGTSVDALLLATDRAARVGANRLVGNVVLVATAAAALASNPAAESLVAAFVVGAAVKVALGVVAARSTIGKPTFAVDVARTLVRAAVPFALAALTSFLYFRADIVLLAALKDDESVGQYGAAYRFLDGLLLVPVALAYTFFPAWTGRTKESRHTFLLVKILVVLGTLGAFVTIIAGPYFCRAILGSDYWAAGRALQILAIGLPVLFVDVVAVWFAFSHGREWAVIKIGAVALGVNLASNLLLIPRYDLNGAAVATLLSEVANFLGYAVLFRHLAKNRIREILGLALRVGIATTAAAGTVFVIGLGSLPIVVDVAAGIAMLLAVLALSGLFTPSDFRQLSGGRGGSKRALA